VNDPGKTCRAQRAITSVDSALNVVCPACNAKPGVHCKRPSGHRIFGGGEHGSRYTLAASLKDSVAGGIFRPGLKVRFFRVIDPEGITRHGRFLGRGVKFWVKKSSSQEHVKRWLREKRIEEVGSI
jgi:hypothetical protein